MPERTVVIDAGIGVKLVLPSPFREFYRELILHLVTTGCELVAPTLWVYEATSTLCRSIHFGELTVEEGERGLSQLQSIDLRLVSPSDQLSRRAFDWTIRLRRAAAYDSYYLALAETLSCDFLTTDRRLRNAVDMPWVHLISPERTEAPHAP